MNASTRRIRPRVLAVAGLFVFVVSCVGTRDEPHAIQVRETDLIVQNRTNAAWSNVEVWVNDHFRGVAPSLQPWQQLTVPLSGLQAAYGQRFDRSRQTVFGVLVTAHTSDGSQVRLTWGKVRRQ